MVVVPVVSSGAHEKVGATSQSDVPTFPMDSWLVAYMYMQEGISTYFYTALEAQCRDYVDCN